MKKVISIILSLVMILAALPLTGISSFAETGDSYKSGQIGNNVYYNFDTANGRLVISGSGSTFNYTIHYDSQRHLTVPSSPLYDLYTYLRNRQYLNSVHVLIEDGVTSIGNYLFSCCNNIGMVTIPQSVTSIGEGAFWGCYNLRSVELPGGVTKINADTFKGCHALKTVTIGTGVTKIEKGAFNGCGQLTTVNYAGTQSEWDNIDIDYIYNSHLFRVKAQSQISGQIDNITYTVNPTTREMVIGGSGTIPDGVFDHDGFINSLVVLSGVNGLSDKAFQGCTSLTNVVINDIPYISKWAFSDCAALISVTLGNGVTDIGLGAFSCCDALSYVSLPGTLERIQSLAFELCSSLTSIDLPYGLKTIQGMAFNGAGLTSITIPGSVTDIVMSPFSGCDRLANIVVSGGNTVYDSRNSCKAIIETAANKLIAGCKNTVIPDTVTVIGKQAFQNCTGLTGITIPDSVCDIRESAFQNCTGLTGVSIPDSVTSIGQYAFENCTGLTGVTMSDGLATISKYVFKNCTGLTSVRIPDTVTEIEDCAFENCTGLKGITIPGTVSTLGAKLFGNCTGLTSATLGSGMTDVPVSLFYNCTNLKSVFIPDSVAVVRTHAFYGCNKLDDAFFSGTEAEWNSINIVNTEDCNGALVNRATKHFYSGLCGDYAFYEYKFASNELIISGMGAMYDYNSSNPGYHPFRSAVSKITVSEGITRIGSYVFYDMQNATSVTIPSTVTHINANAFRDCNSLSDVYYLGSQDDWNDLIIGANNQALTNATLHLSETGACGDSATYCYNSDIGALTIRGTGDMYDYENDYAPWHNYRSSIVSITVEEGITSIGDYAFGDTNITEITIPSSVTEIGSRALQNCRGLTEIDIHEGITSVGEAAFDGCRGLTRVVIPEGVTEISYAAFYNCTNLAEVTIPYSVGSIGNYAFDGCSSLADIYYPGTKQDWYSLNTGNNESILDGAVRHYEIYNITGEIEDTELEWKYNPVSCVLTLSGEGEIPEELARPWQGNRNEIKKIVIEDGITKISDYLFTNHNGVETVCIGKNVASIGLGTFAHCSSLTDVYYNGTQSAWEEITVGEDNDRLTNATMHYGKSGWCGILDYYDEPSEDVQYNFNPCTATLTIYGTGAMADSWAPWANSSAGTLKNDIKTVEIEDGVTHIGEDVFWGNPNIEIVVIGPDVTSIGLEAFLNCNKIAHVFYDGSQADWNNISIGAGNECLTNATIHFAETGVCGDNAKYAFNLYTDKLTITGSGDIYDYSVDSPFDSDLRIESVAIGNGITRIGGWAFNGCANIKSVKMPSTLTSIGEYAFRTCSGLKSVTIPDSVTAIENGAFTQCTGMKNLELSENLTTLGNYAFSSCEKLEFVLVPASITSFGSEVFSGCTGLTGVKFANGLTSIGVRAFTDCTSLTEIFIPDSVQTIMNYAFAGCTALEFATFGSGYRSGLTRIYVGAFSGCTALSGVVYYGSVADWYSINIGNTNLPLKDAVKECTVDSKLTARCGTNVNWILDVATGALTVSGTGDMFDYDYNLNKFASFFAYRERIKTITVESGVTSVGNWAFWGCTEATEITLADTVTSIGEGALGACKSLTDFVIPSGITVINMGSFAGCSSLASVTIPASVTEIDYMAFYECNALATVNYPGSDDDWYEVTIGSGNDPLLKVKPQIKSGSCGDNLTYSFDKATGVLTISGTGPMYDLALSTIPWFDVRLDIKGLVIKPGVTSIGNHAFAASVNMVYAVIPETVTSIVSNAFVTCNKLEYIVCYEDSFAATFDTAKTTYLGDVDMSGGIGQSDYALIRNKLSSNSNSLSAIQLILADYDIDGAIDAFDLFMLDKTMNGLPLYSFSYSALSGNNVQITGFGGRGVDIVVPATINGYTVTEVGNYAFKNNNQIQNVKISNGITKVMYGTFLNCRQLRTVELANSVTSIGSYCFKDCTNLTSVKIPASVTTIQATAFTNCPNVTIYGAAGSYAETFANNNSITFVAVT